jgi:hypothetical protein
VTISDALPIQFWLVDCDTYNEREVCGVHRKCWCQPWECNDPIIIQLTETDSRPYALNVYDEDDQLIASMDMDNTPLNDVAAIPAIPGEESSVDDLPPLSSGVNIAGSGENWTTGSNPSVTLPGSVGTHESDKWANNYSFIEDYDYEFTINLDHDSAVTIDFYILDSSNNVLYSDSSQALLSGPSNFIFSFTAIAGMAKYSIVVSHVIVGAPISDNDIDINTITATQTTPETPEVPYVPATIFLNQVSFIPSETSPNLCERIQLKIVDLTSPDTIVAKSDCIDIQNNHDCTMLWRYSNNRNFAGLIYEDISPETTFSIRIPAIFFHDRFPEEDNVIQLTESIEKLSGTLTSQRLLETDYIPYYMHRKIQLILKHQTVLIDGQYWTKQEPYEIQDGDRRWPVKKAKCFLTEKNYVQRAIL